MKLDGLGLVGACSYALDCVETELVHVTDRHAKRVAYMSVCVAEQMGIQGKSLQDLTICALLHDNALTQYIQEELHNDIAQAATSSEFPHVGVHCSMGERNMQKLPSYADFRNVILYHHENANGSGPFGKTWQEVPLFARIIHLCDLLDLVCGTKTFTPDIWKKACDFLGKVKGTAVDEECINAFLHAFSEQHFLSLGKEDLEMRLWSRVPREKQDFSFEQIKGLAQFFAQIVDYKSPFTSRHSIGVAEDAEKLSRFMGFDEETSQKMYLAGALHDIGKVAIGNEILEKPGRLTEDEFAEMKDHASCTYYILSEIDDFDEMRDWAAFHHERLDGSGYPFGKTAAELNTQERIMACVDVYQALTEDRPYKKGMSHEKACSILTDMAEKGWLDAEIVKQVDVCFKGENSKMTDEIFMKQAIDLSKAAVEHGNEPFGAVLVKDGEVVFTNENQIYTRHDPTFHGEAGLIREFCAQTGITDLHEYTLYSSCEPCFMCSGALVWVKLGRLVYGASNIDLENILGNEGCNCSRMVFENSFWKPQVTEGVLREESLVILKEYFGKHTKG